MRPIPKYVGLAVLLAMAGFAGIGFFAIRRDVDNLRVISQDNLLWSATQMEVELLRFELSISTLSLEKTPAALESAQHRFEILWSRVFMMGTGRVGQQMRKYDEGHGSLEAIGSYLKEIDPILLNLSPTDEETIDQILSDLREFQKELRLYTLRVVRADTAASAQVRNRIQTSSMTTGFISLAAVLLSVLSLYMILREYRRQRDIANVNIQMAEEAKRASDAKSRFLSMMSHEMRNPLNGILGPLALLEQSALEPSQKKLVDQAKACGQSVLQMLAGLLDYGEMQDGPLKLRPEPFSLRMMADSVGSTLTNTGVAGLEVRLAPNTPSRVIGDRDRVKQILVHLCEYVLEASGPETVDLSLKHDGMNLICDIGFDLDGPAINWKLDLLMGLSEHGADQVTADALRPLIARGLISACNGMLTLVDDDSGHRIIRVSVPAEPVREESITVHLETRSAALAAIYRAALKSDRVVFAAEDAGEEVDVVLVDSTSVGGDPLMKMLRQRYPNALFVSLGDTNFPEDFDDIVEKPNDMGRLRSSILGRLAS